MTDIVVVIRAGSIGQAIACRVSAGKQVLLVDPWYSEMVGALRMGADGGLIVGSDFEWMAV